MSRSGREGVKFHKHFADVTNGNPLEFNATISKHYYVAMKICKAGRGQTCEENSCSKSGPCTGDGAGILGKVGVVGGKVMNELERSGDPNEKLSQQGTRMYVCK